jgi:DNA modification methylase
MELKKIPVNKLKPAQYNPRLDLKPEDSEYQKIKTSITEFGYIDPLIVNSDFTVIGGHQRLKVLIELGHKEIDCIVVNVDKTKEKALNLALNKISGDWDLPKLKDLLQEIDTGEFDIEITGFDEKEIEDLMNQLYTPDENEKDDDVPEVPEEPITKLGDLYKLGEHRLLCGDAAKIDDVEKLLSGEKIDLIVSSPPYFNQREYSYWKNYNDYCEFIKSVINNIWIISNFNCVCCWNIGNDVPHNLDMPAHQSIMFSDVGFEFLDEIVWKKSGAVYSIPRSAHIKSTGHFYPALAWEPIKVFKKGNLPSMEPEDKNYMNSCGTNVWEINQVFGSEQKKIGHIALFPVELASRCIKAYSNKEKIIYDCFGGGGTTLIASEKLKRRAMLMEIEPKYCDVIVKRWEDYTGKKAELIIDDKTRS